MVQSHAKTNGIKVNVKVKKRLHGVDSRRLLHQLQVQAQQYLHPPFLHLLLLHRPQPQDLLKYLQQSHHVHVHHNQQQHHLQILVLVLAAIVMKEYAATVMLI